MYLLSTVEVFKPPQTAPLTGTPMFNYTSLWETVHIQDTWGDSFLTGFKPHSPGWNALGTLTWVDPKP